MAKFRILTLDGGGSWALIQAMALKDLFDDLPGHELLGQFSFAAANSGGSIVLAGLLANMRPSQILGMFQNEDARKSVFSALSPLDKAANGLSELFAGGPRYYSSKKLAGLRAFLSSPGDRQLPDARDAITNASGNRPHFLITTFDFDRLRSIYLRSDSYSKVASELATGATTLAEAVHASSNAPIKYFDAPAVINYRNGTRNCWDGALAGVNNPILAAVVETLGNQYHVVTGTPSPIEVLSIGTGTVRLPLQDGTIDSALAKTPMTHPGFSDNLSIASSVILDDPPDAATFESHIILGGSVVTGEVPMKLPIVRLSPLVQPMIVEKDGDVTYVQPTGIGYLPGQNFQTLVNMDMDAVPNDSVTLITSFAEAWMAGGVLNQPLRADDLLRLELGHNTYPEGKSDWKTKLSADPNVVRLP